jgi:hypothetical protein
MDCSESMYRFARRIEGLLNSDALHGYRVRAMRDAVAARAAYQPGARQTVRPLDGRSRAELRQVLAYCKRQPDWRARSESLFRGPIAGFGHASGPRLIARLASGDMLQLVREADNPHDPLAVRIEWNGRKLGYVPREDNPPIARLLGAGEPLAATIVAVRPDERWAPVDCAIVRASQFSASVEAVEACA